LREYYKNPQKTAETLKMDGCTPVTSPVSMRMDFFWITDRKKDVIITGGENIYPVEIEEILHITLKFMMLP